MKSPQRDTYTAPQEYILIPQSCLFIDTNSSILLLPSTAKETSYVPIMVSIKQLALFALTTGLATVDAQTTGKTTRYWDCCKGSCGWSGKASVTQPIRSCDKNDNPLSDMGAKNACDNGGSAYMCTNQSPWAVNDDL